MKKIKLIGIKITIESKYMIRIKYNSVSKNILFSYKQYLNFLFLKLNNPSLKYKFINTPSKKKKKNFFKISAC